MVKKWAGVYNTNMSVIKIERGYYKIKGAVSINGKKYYYQRQDTNNPNWKSKKYCEKLEKEIRDQLFFENNKHVDFVLFNTFFNSFKEHQFLKYSEKTKKNFVDTFEKHLKEVFCFSNSVEEELTIKRYKEFYEYIGNQKFSTGHKNRMLFYAREMTNHARNNHYVSADLKEDLIAILDNFKASTSEIHKKEIKSNKYTTRENAEKVFKECEFPFNYVFRLFYYSGCRIGEFLAITKNDVEFIDDEAIIEINKQVDHNFKGKINENLKTVSSYRKIKFNKVLALCLKDYLDKNKFDKNDLIFNFSRSTFRKKLNEALAKAGVEHNTLHGFGRKSISTEMFLASNNPKASQIHLGHKDVNTTLNTYVANESQEGLVTEVLTKVTDGVNNSDKKED